MNVDGRTLIDGSIGFGFVLPPKDVCIQESIYQIPKRRFPIEGGLGLTSRSRLGNSQEASEVLPHRSAPIGPVGFSAEKFRVHERVEDVLAQLALDSTEALDLFGLETEARHFEILGANAFQYLLIRGSVHGHLSPPSPSSR